MFGGEVRKGRSARKRERKEAKQVSFLAGEISRPGGVDRWEMLCSGSLVGAGELCCKQRGRARPGTSLTSAPSYRVAVAQHTNMHQEHHEMKGEKKHKLR